MTEVSVDRGIGRADRERVADGALADGRWQRWQMAEMAGGVCSTVQHVNFDREDYMTPQLKSFLPGPHDSLGNTDNDLLALMMMMQHNDGDLPH